MCSKQLDDYYTFRNRCLQSEFQFNKYLEKLDETKNEKVGVGKLGVVMLNKYLGFEDLKDHKIITKLKSSCFSLNDDTQSSALKESNLCADYSSFGHLRSSNSRVKLTDKTVTKVNVSHDVDMIEIIDHDDAVTVVEDEPAPKDEDVIFVSDVPPSHKTENHIAIENGIGEYVNIL